MREDTKVLDHGYVRLVDAMGSDQSIIEAARMSTQKGFEGWGPQYRCGNKACGIEISSAGGSPEGKPCPISGDMIVAVPGDEKLLKYLWENKHATPFEMAVAVFEVQAPIFVFREWHRHRTQSFNEASARYAPLPDINYVPTVDRLMVGGGHLTKQAGTVAGAASLTESSAKLFQVLLREQYSAAERLYQNALTNGVPKEVARVMLPVGRYSRMRASANLRNWLAFLTLRQDPKAQYEIRVYAHAVHDLLVERFPRTMSLFDAGKS